MRNYTQPEKQQAVRDELARILSSRNFYASRRFRDFLTFLVEETLAGRGPEIKAYIIATQVFKRSADFDPQSDSLVRVEAAKLRNRLTTYYRNHPNEGEVEISIPKGHYIAKFSWRKTKTKSPGKSSQKPPQLKIHSKSNLSQSAQALSKPTIVIFPFSNLSPNNKNSHLVNGLVEEIIIGLTRFQELNVVNANFSRPEQNNDPCLFAQSLDARFILQGSMQAMGKSLRIRINLTDAQSHNTIWGERYDSAYDTGNLISVLDEITNKVLAGIGGSFGFISKSLLSELNVNGEQHPVTDKFAAYEAVLHYHNWIGTMSGKNANFARSALEEAIVLDPQYALAKGMLADIYAATSQWSLSKDEGEDLENRSMLLALEAEKLNPRCQYSQWGKTFNLFLRKEGDEFLKNARFVLALNPANTNITSAVGLKLVVYGECDEGMKIIEHSSRLNPFLPGWHHLAPFIIHYMNDDLEAALNEANKMLLPGYIVGPLIRAAALGRMEQSEHAATEAETVLSICPKFATTGRRTISKLLFHNHQTEALIKGLKMAGLSVH